MNKSTPPLEPHSIFPHFVLLSASALGVFLVAGRIAWTGHWRPLYLVWNLFLAWIPLALALLAARIEQRHGIRNWRFLAIAAAWLLFFPNAPYIFTDLVHLGSARPKWFWVDLSLILMFAWTGLMVGLLSLQRMHRLVAGRYGRVMGWLFAFVAAGLSGIGVCLGRFLRWNSWDVLVQPLGLVSDMFYWLHAMPDRKLVVVIPLLFSAFIAMAYVTFHAVTQSTTARLAAAHPSPGTLQSS